MDKCVKRHEKKYKKLNISRTKRGFQIKYKGFFIVFEGLSFDGGRTYQIQKL